MTRPSNSGTLVLSPRDPVAEPGDAPTLIDGLSVLGFIGPALGNGDEKTFLIGPRFLQLIAFMGCSPHIEVAPPPEGGSFCHIRVHGPLPAPVLLAGRNSQARCGLCRRRLSEWRVLLEGLQPLLPRQRIRCPYCSGEQSPLDLSWRRSAGYGRLFLRIEDVFPGEAVPVDELLRRLRDLGRQPWDWFYIQAGGG